MSIFEEVTEYPPDQIYGLIQDFADEKNPNKVDLSIGVYKDETLQPACFDVVKQVERVLLEEEKAKAYFPIEGYNLFNKLTTDLFFGKGPHQKSMFTAQAPGGSGALRVIGEFLYSLGFRNIALPVPTWSNHRLLFQNAGLHLHPYSYYNNSTGRLEIEETVEQLSMLPDKTAVLFHGCCHNPTGLDPTQEEWKILSQACKEHAVFPVFDVAYLGLGDGIEEDRFSVQQFLQDGHEMLVACSYSKNFGLYGERTGAVIAVAEREDRAEALKSSVKRVIRGMYSSPPRHGALIVAKILEEAKLSEDWKEEMARMRQRMSLVRSTFSKQLSERLGVDFTYLDQRRGMFIKIGLEEDMVMKLRKEYAIYMPSSGRINICGINDSNIEYVLDAISKVKGD